MNVRAEGRYRLRLYQYSGGAVDLIEEGSSAECRQEAARRITRHRNKLRYPVSILERGSKWELETGDDALMIGDTEGFLAIEELPEDPEPEDDEDGDEAVIPCDGCGEMTYESALIDGLCPDCRQEFDIEEED